MTTSEFSIEFDLIYNNINSNIAVGINEYEKSIFLTEAQNTLITRLYNGSLSGLSFEGSEEITETLKEIVTDYSPTLTLKKGIESYSRIYTLPDDLLYIVHEKATLNDINNRCISNRSVHISPITHDQYNRVKKNPFRGVSSDRILRLMNSDGIELIHPSTISNYRIRYIRRPKPIILTDLSSENLYITASKVEYNAVTECELNEMLHRDILLLAIQLAKSSWGNGN